MAVFMDFVQGPGSTAAAVANRTSLGSLTLPQSARKILGFKVTAAPVGTYAASKILAGYIQVESEDVNIEPFHIPLEPVGGYLTLGGGFVKEATLWIANHPCDGGSVLDFYNVADVAPNAAPEIQVTTIFSDGTSPYGNAPLHMKAGEPATSLSTSDNGEANLDDIEIKARNLLRLWAYAGFTTLVADSAVVATAEVTSDDFAVAGPCKFGVNPNVGGDANMGTAGLELTKHDMDRAFRVAAQKQTVKCKMTMRDAVSTAPLANWGLVYL